MQLRALVLALVTTLAACAGPRHGLVEDDGRMRFADVPVPAGYALLTPVEDEGRPPRDLLYERRTGAPLTEEELVTFYAAELPKHGWLDVTHDADKGSISGRKPGEGQAPSVVVVVLTRIGASASEETRRMLAALGAESPEAQAARAFAVVRGAQ